jgi:TPR repeat protein
MLDPPERAEALMYWKRAAEAGHAEAQQLLEDFENG